MLITKGNQVACLRGSGPPASGSGGNFIVVDEQNDLVVVVRWMPDLNGFLKIVLDAVKQ